MGTGDAVTIEQSGEFLRMSFDNGPRLDLTLASWSTSAGSGSAGAAMGTSAAAGASLATSAGAAAGAAAGAGAGPRLTMQWSGNPWSATFEGPAGGTAFDFRFSGPQSCAFVAERADRPADGQGGAAGGGESAGGGAANTTH